VGVRGKVFKDDYFSIYICADQHVIHYSKGPDSGSESDLDPGATRVKQAAIRGGEDGALGQALKLAGGE
jgi:hypothetical protein